MVICIAAKLAIDAHDTVGEGPAWDAAGKRLLWSDNEHGIVHEARVDDSGAWRESRRWSLHRPIGAVVPRRKGGVVVASGTEILIMDEAGGLAPFARLDADASRVRFNDIKCDSRGRLWAGTLVSDFGSPGAALYRVEPDGTITRMIDDVTVSNGLDWSPDGSTFYYIDSLTMSVEAFDFDAAGGTLANRRTLLAVKRGEGAPDGMTVDREGCLWVAIVGAGEVRRYAPDGTLLARVAISHPGVTSCAFGGEEGGDLLITSLGRRMPDVAFELGFTRAMVENPATAAEGGGLFVCRPGVTGKPATPFAG